MSFRARIAIGAAAAVALAVVLASVVVFFVVRGELRAQIDDTLEERAQEIFRIPLAEIPLRNGESFLGIRPGFGEPNTFVQVVKADGETLRQLYDDVELPVSDEALALTRAGMRGDSVTSETEIDGTHVRVLSVAYEPGYAVQIARPLTEMDETLSRLRLFLIAIALCGIGIAAGLGLVVSRAALTPVRRLTETAERVTETGDLSERIEVGGRDELSRLATSFNTMLAGLEDANRAQRQLVADASHELRTPLTSLRTNIEVLAGDRALPADERSRLLSDVVEQLGEMTTLIAGLIELARAEQQTARPEDVRLDLVVANAIERTQRNRPGVAFTARARGVRRPGGSRHDRSCGRQPHRQRGQVEPAERRDRDRGARRPGVGSRSRPRDRRRGSPVRLRPFLPRSVGSRECQGRASGSRSSVRSRTRTAARSSPSGPKAVGRG